MLKVVHASLLLSICFGSVLAEGIAFPASVKCSNADNCYEKSYGYPKKKDAGMLITLKLKAFEQLDAKKQNPQNYDASLSAAREILSLFTDGGLGIPDPGWIITLRDGDSLISGSLMLMYEAEMKRNANKYAGPQDWLDSHEDNLRQLKQSKSYLSMRELAANPKKLAPIVLEEIKNKAEMIYR